MNFAVKQFVCVKNLEKGPNLDEDSDASRHWIARILQVRARDTQHVYALVSKANPSVGVETNSS